ncbi:hypothetical protein [Tautonia sociabilis]|uniref:EF-hand domain-containing protein n=1 Tax=Tautonia sociabilis TaxID=2080755 RepID=A0A432MCG3_9BACT|nr:hypothetical protein [Tautonia sociabilis]RUL81852.1 hypothetical protein TsocGM_24385 [Tautonia sociabilis]
MNRPILATAAWLLLAAGPAGARPASDLPDNLFATSPADAVLDLVVMADDHPIVARYRITIGGVGHRLAFGEFIVQLSAYLDADDDRRLTPDELGRGPWAQLFAAQPFDQVRPNPDRPDEGGPDANGDGRISCDELVRHVRESLGIEPMTRTGGAPPDPRTERPFEHLDRDGNGRLDTDEIARAAERLSSLDRDQDEWVVLDEMNPYSTNVRRYFGIRVSSGGLPPDHPFVVLGASEDRAKIAGLLLDRYDRDGDGRIDLAELGLPGERAAPLDASGLARWLEAPTPHLEFKVELAPPGQARGPMVFERIAAVDSIADALGPPEDTSQVLDLGPITVELGVDASYSDYRSFLFQNFDSSDADDSGSLDRSEIDNGTIISRLFDAADRDGDGSFSREELTSYMSMYEAAFAARLSLSISDLGRAVYQSMDPDDDFRLSLRELLGIPELLSARDRDGDGTVVLEEFPHRYRLNIGLGPARPSNRFIETGPQRRPSPAGEGVPSWFTRMDRNGDGDVSRREFLGPLEVFTGLDRDGDGLVSAEDAARPIR